jgi:hypothetical protein
LPYDFRSEIDLVAGWANTGTELHDHVRGIGPEAFNHLSDRVCHDTKFGSFAPGVHKANCRRCWIDDVNCATIGDVNAERETALIGDNAIARGEFATINSAEDSGRYSAFDNGNFVSVDLFGGEQRPTPTSSRARDFIGVAKAGFFANFAMCGVEPLQHFGFIV